MPSLIVNGRERRLALDTYTPLPGVRRDHLAPTGRKCGGGIGVCGACTVRVDGRAERACLLAPGELEGARLTTIEGLSPDGDHPLQRPWIAEQVARCGYGQPARSMAAALAEILCRCGSYQRIRRPIGRCART